MLLLINRRYPALGSALSLITAAACTAIGVDRSSRLMIIMGAISLVIAIARISHRHSHAAQPRA
jgi:hypothetical protein